MLYLISDQHFGHKNIIKYCDRPFPDVIENARFMYDAYQDTISDNDIVVFLGDIALFTSKTREPFKQMFRSFKGNKFLIKGNHDTLTTSFYLDCGFKSVSQYFIIKDTMLCHYPLNDDSQPVLKKLLHQHCTTLYHGHTHQRIVESADGIKRINCCVELTNYAPLKVDNDEIESYFKSLLEW